LKTIKRRIELIRIVMLVVGLLSADLSVAFAQEAKAGKKTEEKKPVGALSFKKDIFPIIEKHCLPCHAEDEFNPSELSLDNYKLLAAGGKTGPAFVAGKSDKSLLIQKLQDNPPEGDRMPLNSKKKIKEGKAVWLSDEEVQTIATWVDQGAKDN
jgi:hypothetical protein